MKYIFVLDYAEDNQMDFVRMIIRELPSLNVHILKYLVQFLEMVMENKSNKMDSNNLAIVFGPNLARSQDQSLSIEALIAYNNWTSTIYEISAG